ncbi:putative holin-like toxin [Tuberibacillus sp. Marseille-P3662]|nr:putative holin-like toxin [Tuberibacillus sp. Marseille-P3662]
MTTYETLTLMINFGIFIAGFLTAIVAIVVSLNQKK